MALYWLGAKIYVCEGVVSHSCRSARLFWWFVWPPLYGTSSKCFYGGTMSGWFLAGLKKWFVGWGKKKKHVLVFAGGSTKKATRRLPNVPSPSGCVGVACWIGLNTIWLEERGNDCFSSAVSVFGRKFAHCWLKQISLSIDSATSERVLRTFVCLRLAKNRFQLTANHSRT